ncbi:MAG: Oligopeptide ABC transporter, periplasmic oligopeptide-binding protein OppA [uncultured Solirubrobacteraceae bacterium]|uniref:Oligopeptide ABC transporter, periplasmic oligopeptide-binding protein OppA n=1 Tax=uncultured Solirubrobacteraceae bacterium TaxID=1162706 RepID=A0A6J4RH81_9ACTN|nr:MAG: Oligopeptide ABC transporter, periplasmic oligopeptide-binding protein OppA [uncultured Solirubrobacteraceae bacterium]
MLRRLLPTIAIMLAAALALPHVVAGQDPQDPPSRLRIAIPGDDGSLTPYTFESGYAFMSLVYDTLTWRDAAGNPKPWLARSITRDASGLVVTVRLRPDVKWHDGRPLTADDVVFTYRFMVDRPHPRFTAQLQDIERVDRVAPLVVRFTLRRRALGLEDQPFADVPILPRHLWSGLPRNRRAPAGLPVGSGPYRLTRYRRGSSYRFDANRDYFRGTPSVPRIDVPIIGREDTLSDQLRRRLIDAAPLTIPPGTRRSRPSGLRVADEVSYSGTMLLFNVAGRPFRRLVARRAVSSALDLDAIAANATGAAGGVVPAEGGIVHPRSPWARAGKLHRFDAAAARLAFAEQGIDAFRVAAASNDPVRLETGRRVVRALRSAGARVRLVELSPKALDRVLGRRGAPASFDVAVLGIPALVSYDPAFLRATFGDPSTAPLNDGGYRSEGFDTLAARSASARTRAERGVVVVRQLKLLARELPAVPLHFGGGAFVYRPAAYDRWVAIRGTGILDKRSFLRGQAAQTSGTVRSAGPQDVTDSSDDQGFSLVPIIIGFVVLALAGCLWWLRPGRR